MQIGANMLTVILNYVVSQCVNPVLSAIGSLTGSSTHIVDVLVHVTDTYELRH